MGFLGVFILQLLVAAILYTILTLQIRRRTRASVLIGNVRDEVNEIIAELNGTTDQHITLLEDRLDSLRLELDRAEHVLRGYQMGASRVAAEEDEAFILSLKGSPPVHPVGSPDEASAAADGSQTGDTPEEYGSVPVDVASTDVASTDVASTDGDSEPTLPFNEEETVRQRVIRLHQTGLAPDRIAADTGLTIGEVQLMLSLYTERGMRR